MSIFKNVSFHSFLLIATLTILSTSFFFLFTKDQDQCFFNIYNNEWLDCAPKIYLYCDTPAKNFHSVLPGLDATVNIYMICGWKPTTSITGYVALGVAVIFLLISSVNIKSYKLTLFKAFAGFLATTGLLVASIMMAVDISEGRDGKLVYYEQPVLDLISSQGGYAVNMMMFFLGTVAVLALTYSRYKRQTHKKDSFLMKGEYEHHHIEIFSEN